jgi:hypothetical protein
MNCVKCFEDDGSTGAHRLPKRRFCCARAAAVQGRLCRSSTIRRNSKTRPEKCRPQSDNSNNWVDAHTSVNSHANRPVNKVDRGRAEIACRLGANSRYLNGMLHVQILELCQILGIHDPQPRLLSSRPENLTSVIQTEKPMKSDSPRKRRIFETDYDWQQA